MKNRTIRNFQLAVLTSLVCVSFAGPVAADAYDSEAYDTTLNMKNDQGPAFAMLFNPLGMAVSAGYGMLEIGVDLQFRTSRYVSLDIRPQFAYVLDSGVVGGGFDGGVRITPQGKGLRGFYIVPRAGYLNVDGISAVPISLELGYSWIWSHFILNTGAGVVYLAVPDSSVEVATPVLPMLNLSIGFTS